jgi:hypothetical protein
MLIEDGWRIPFGPATETLIKPRESTTVRGGNAILVQLRNLDFLDDRNHVTEAGRRAFQADSKYIPLVPKQSIGE